MFTQNKLKRRGEAIQQTVFDPSNRQAIADLAVLNKGPVLGRAGQLLVPCAQHNGAVRVLLQVLQDAERRAQLPHNVRRRLGAQRLGD